MGFWILLLVCNLLIPIIMLVFGFMFQNKGPDKINGIYGYRTTMSMKNEETWNFAHTYCAKIWRNLGFAILILTVIASMMAFNLDENGQGMLEVLLVSIQTIVLIASIFPVEKALRKNFDKNGNRKA